MTPHIQLSPQLENIVRQKIASGKIEPVRQPESPDIKPEM
jgi:hypothetical protein